MPWKATCTMTEKLRFIVECNESEESLAELCRRFGISRKTGYKWLERVEETGPSGLEERRPVPRVVPHRVADVVVGHILELRSKHPKWGPRKLRALLIQTKPEMSWPAASTIGDVRKRHGRIAPGRRLGRAATPSPSPLSPSKQPNDLWCTDFKGHFGLGDGTRCYPLTITDEFSRYVLACQGLLRTGVEPVKQHFERVFREFGLPWRIRSDNGPPFASTGPGGLTALAVWWIKLGIRPERIEPGEPQQNGRHERMHRSLKLEVDVSPTLLEQQPVLERFRRQFNEVRPHEALGLTPPARHYTPSVRPVPMKLCVPEYVDAVVRWANGGGSVSFHGHLVSVGNCLCGEPVGFRQVGETQWEAFYGPVCLGVLDERDDKVRLKPKPLSVPDPGAIGAGDGFAFSCGQPADGLPTGKPPSPPSVFDDFWREEEP